MAGTRYSGRRAGWRYLGLFWLAVLTLLSAGAGTLQWLGAPGGIEPIRLARNVGVPAPVPPAPIPAAPIPAASVAAAPVPPASVQNVAHDAEPVIVIASPRQVIEVAVGRDTPGPIADPDPALLEPAGPGSPARISPSGVVKENLPRIASDGRTSMQVYAAGFDHSSRRPRVSLLLAGIGMNEAESAAAIRTLPGAVSLAVSPYATNLPKLLATARTTGHEYLVAVPLEPAGFPLNDPGPSTLLTSLPVAANAQNLLWALSRVDGYVGATGVIGTMRGERLAAVTDQMDAVLSELSGRGLLYIDPREDRGAKGIAVARTWGRHVEVVIDDPADQDVADRTMIDAKLAELERLAKDDGSALGLVMRPTPVTVARIATWSNGLADRGMALAPVSAVMLPPSGGPVKLSERE